MSAPAAAFVAVAQFFSRYKVFVFLMYVALTTRVARVEHARNQRRRCRDGDGERCRKDARD
jgi:hypothetical protein